MSGQSGVRHRKVSVVQQIASGATLENPRPGCWSLTTRAPRPESCCRPRSTLTTSRRARPSQRASRASPSSTPAPFPKAREAFASQCQAGQHDGHISRPGHRSLSLHDGARLGFLNRYSRASGPMVARRRSLTTATIPTTRTTTKRMSNHHTADLPPCVYYPTGSPQIGITRRRRLLNPRHSRHPSYPNRVGLVRLADLRDGSSTGAGQCVSLRLPTLWDRWRCQLHMASRM